eukprot:5111694-Pleurochrysis_carterae.AAC.1
MPTAHPSSTRPSPHPTSIVDTAPPISHAPPPPRRTDLADLADLASSPSADRGDACKKQVKRTMP